MENKKQDCQKKHVQNENSNNYKQEPLQTDANLSRLSKQKDTREVVSTSSKIILNSKALLKEPSNAMEAKTQVVLNTSNQKGYPFVQANGELSPEAPPNVSSKEFSHEVLPNTLNEESSPEVLPNTLNEESSPEVLAKTSNEKFEARSEQVITSSEVANPNVLSNASNQEVLQNTLNQINLIGNNGESQCCRDTKHEMHNCDSFLNSPFLGHNRTKPLPEHDLGVPGYCVKCERLGVRFRLCCGHTLCKACFNSDDLECPAAACYHQLTQEIRSRTVQLREPEHEIFE